MIIKHFSYISLILFFCGIIISCGVNDKQLGMKKRHKEDSSDFVLTKVWEYQEPSGKKQIVKTNIEKVYTETQVNISKYGDLSIVFYSKDNSIMFGSQNYITIEIQDSDEKVLKRFKHEYPLGVKKGHIDTFSTKIPEYFVRSAKWLSVFHECRWGGKKKYTCSCSIFEDKDF